MHDHSPCKHRYAVARFLWFILSPVETFRCSRDGFDICAICKAEIVLPDAYFGLAIKLVYILGGVAFGLIEPILPLLNVLFTTLLMLAVDHIISAFVFAFFPWEENEMRSTDTIRADAKKEEFRKGCCLIAGFVPAFLYHFYF